jgi:hypothetical protein
MKLIPPVDEACERPLVPPYGPKFAAAVLDPELNYKNGGLSCSLAVALGCDARNVGAGGSNPLCSTIQSLRVRTSRTIACPRGCLSRFQYLSCSEEVYVDFCVDAFYICAGFSAAQ